MKLIDIHAHLNFPQFEADRAEVIRRTGEAGVGVINVGTDRQTSAEVVKLAEENEAMWATVGLHPAEAEEGFDYEFYKNLAAHQKVVGVGECGLDYYRSPNFKIPACGTGRPACGTGRQISKQKEIFEKQIALARELNQPLMIHCRQAYAEVLAILKKHPGVRGNLHFFTGDWPAAKRFLDLGFSLSFSGVITFANDYDEVVKKTPLDRVLAETDAPFAAPAPYGGRRNEPLYLQETVSRIAELKGLPEPEVRQTILENAERLFALRLPTEH